MSAEADRAMAKALADRSTEQAKHASKNAGRAAKAAAKAAAEEAGDVVESANDAVEDAAEAVSDKVIKPSIRFLPTPGGKATLGYIVGVAAIAYATRQLKLSSRYPFGSASTAASRASAAKADHHIRPSE